MRKILIATPIRQGISSGFFQWLQPVMSNPRLLEGREFGFAILDGPAVNFARNELAQYALDEGFHEIVLVDDDMGGTLAHLDRITSHPDLFVVGGIYCKRHPGKPQWLVRTTPGAVKDARGLIQCDYIATGWLWIKCQVFDTIREAQPWRDFAVPATDDKPARVLHEYFPMGVVGPRSPEERLAKVCGLLEKPYDGNDPDLSGQRATLLCRLHEAAKAPQQPGNLLGEDYYFCHVARQCGYKIYADLECVVSHIGKAAYPITHKQVQIAEPPKEQPKTVEVDLLWPPDYVRPGILPNHCEDVLRGSYDVDFNPATPPVVLDIGANIGAFARWAAKRWPGAEIHCYEPHPGNYELLQRTAGMIEGATVQTHKVGVAERARTASLVNPSGRNCGEFQIFKPTVHPLSLPATPVELIAATSLPRADVLKIDAEGAEGEIIRSLWIDGRLGDFSAIVLEFHHDKHGEAITELLCQSGFVEVGRKIVAQHRGELKFLRNDVANQANAA